MANLRQRIKQLDKRIDALTAQIKEHEAKYRNAWNQFRIAYWNRDLQDFYRDRSILQDQKRRLEIIRSRRMRH